MPIETLIKVVPPPAAPFEAYDGPWEPIEAEFGVSLPPDYKDFVRLYGSGYFMQFLGVAVPVSANTYVRLAWGAATIRSMLEDVVNPQLLWPSRGGMLPFGGTDNGDTLFWLTRGATAEWPVVVLGRGVTEFETFECDLTDFLAGLATGDTQPEEFPDDLLPNDCLFRPHSPV